MKNGKHERSWKVSLVPPYTWKQALIKTNYILKNWKEGERGNLTDLCLEKKAEMKAEQREETILHPKDNIQALLMIYLQSLTAVWSGINSPDHLPAVPELGESAGHPARTKLSVRNGITAGAQLQADRGGRGRRTADPASTKTPHSLIRLPPRLFLGWFFWERAVGFRGFPWLGGPGRFGFYLCCCFFFLNPSVQPCALRSCLVMNWLPNPFSSV